MRHRKLKIGLTQPSIDDIKRGKMSERIICLLKLPFPMCHPWRRTSYLWGCWIHGGWWSSVKKEVPLDTGGLIPSYQMPMFSLLPKLICFCSWLLWPRFWDSQIALVPFSAESGAWQKLGAAAGHSQPISVTCDTCSSHVWSVPLGICTL